MTKNDWMTRELTMLVDVGSYGFPRNDRDREKLKSLLDTLRSNNIAHVVVNRNGNRKMTSESVMTTMLNLPPAVGKSAGLNLALARVQTEFVMSVDVGSKLDMHGIRVGMEALHSSPDVHYAFGAHDSSAMPRGDMEVGTILSHWGSPHLTFPVAPNAVIVRREALLSVGGYAALPQCEALMTALRLSNAYRGFQGERRMLSGEVGLEVVHDSLNGGDDSLAMTVLETCFEMSYAELRAGRMGSSYGRISIEMELKERPVAEERVPTSVS